MVKAVPKLEVTMAELKVLLTTVVGDVAEIKAQLKIMDENFARKQEVEKNAENIKSLGREVGDLRTDQAVTTSQLKTWGLVGGIIVTLISAFISALQIHF